jgi:hypothetical protein
MMPTAELTNLNDLQLNATNDYLIDVWKLVKEFLTLPGAVHPTPRFREAVIFIGRNSKFDFWLGVSGRLYRDQEIPKKYKRKVEKISLNSLARSLGGSRNTLANAIAIHAAKWAKDLSPHSLTPVIPVPTNQDVMDFIYKLLEASTTEVES